MPTFTPVDFDPFAVQGSNNPPDLNTFKKDDGVPMPQSHIDIGVSPKLVPVDFDPFAAPAAPQAGAAPAGVPMNALERGMHNIASGANDLGSYAFRHLVPDVVQKDIGRNMQELSNTPAGKLVGQMHDSATKNYPRATRDIEDALTMATVTGPHVKPTLEAVGAAGPLAAKGVIGAVDKGITKAIDTASPGYASKLDKVRKASKTDFPGYKEFKEHSDKIFGATDKLDPVYSTELADEWLTESVNKHIPKENAVGSGLTKEQKDFVDMLGNYKIYKGRQFTFQGIRRLDDELEDLITHKPNGQVTPEGRIFLDLQTNLREKAFQNVDKYLEKGQSPKVVQLHQAATKLWGASLKLKDIEKIKAVAAGDQKIERRMLRSLRQNEKKMRFWTAEDKRHLSEAAKGHPIADLVTKITKEKAIGGIVGAGIGAALGHTPAGAVLGFAGGLAAEAITPKVPRAQGMIDYLAKNAKGLVPDLNEAAGKPDFEEFTKKPAASEKAKSKPEDDITDFFQNKKDMGIKTRVKANQRPLKESFEDSMVDYNDAWSKAALKAKAEGKPIPKRFTKRRPFEDY